ncbi:MAG: flagellar hook-length control protein FliK [Gammaproteobacteria bacterium]
MELVASLPPDLATLAHPTARGAAPPLRSTGKDAAAGAAAAPFDLLLALLTAALPAGQSLPGTGNALPAAAADTPVGSPAPSAPTARPVIATLTDTTGAALLARLKLAAAPAGTPVATDQNSAPAEQPGPAANALPVADLDLPATPDAAKPVTVASAAPAAPPAAADTPPRPDVPAALEAALPPTGARDSTPEVRAGQMRAAEQPAALSAAAAGTDLGGTQANSMSAATPVAEVADGATRPDRREAALEAFTLPATMASGDAAALPTSATPAFAPTATHASPAATPTADASTAAGQGAAIDTRADNWHEALASRVQVLVDQHVGEAHIKLNPPELGAVDIKISLVDDKTFVQLTASNAAARDELTQSLPRLRELLSAGGLSLGGASVHGGSGGQAGQDATPRMAAPSAYSPFAAPDDDVIEPVRIAARAAGRIDLFA